MRLAQRYPDDFSDLKGRCGIEEYEEKGKIAYLNAILDKISKILRKS